MIINKQNYYEILEISEEATLQEIERAYVEAKETYSPTSSALYSMFSKEEARELHQLIEQAYNTLSNHNLRQAYDSSQMNASFEETTNEGDNSQVATVQQVITPAEEVKFVNGQIIKNFSKNSSIEEQIKNLQDCSGAFLKRVRNYKNISLDEVSEYSKISKTNILTIEEEDFDNLPAKVFVRGFVVQICKLLGIESVDFSKGYLEALDEHRK